MITTASTSLSRILGARWTMFSSSEQADLLTSIATSLRNSQQIAQAVQHHKRRARFDTTAEYVAPRTPVEQVLASIWADVLSVDQVGIYDPFFALGGDSIVAIQVISRARRAGLHITPRQLLEHQTIAALAHLHTTSMPVQAEQGTVTGDVHLTPIQRWFFEPDQPEAHHWNQAVLLEVSASLHPTLVEQTVQYLLQHHDGLRLRFMRQESGWRQINAETEQNSIFSHIDLAALPSDEQGAAIETAATQLQTSLNLSQGPLVRVALFHLGAHTPGHLLLVIHHLVVDGVSWRILLEDFQTVYGQLERNEQIHVLPKTTSVQQWAERLTVYAHSRELQQELDFWLALPSAGSACVSPDFPTGVNTEGSAQSVAVPFSPEETRILLQDVPADYQTQINDVLLMAVVQAFGNYTGRYALLIDLVGHGREPLFEDIDLSRSVGWFTTVFPAFLALEPKQPPAEALLTIKPQLRRIPGGGVGYFVLRHLSEPTERVSQLRTRPQAQVLFSYLGQFDQLVSEASLFRLAHESTGPGRSPKAYRSHPIEISGMVIGRQLQIDWRYSEQLHRRSTIEALARHFAASLRTIIAASAYTRTL